MRKRYLKPIIRVCTHDFDDRIMIGTGSPLKEGFEGPDIQQEYFSDDESDWKNWKR